MSEKTYTYSEVLEASKEYFYGDEFPATVFTGKYALSKNDNEYVELTPDDMHDRLAGEFARIDSDKYGLSYSERFNVYRDVLDRFARVVPQGGVMGAVGNPYYVMSASNCVVVDPPEDSIGGIMDTGKTLAELYRRRAGVGIDISTLRPDGTPVSNAAKTSTGAWSFADLYSNITKKIGQNSRRGACLISLNVHHPDVFKFANLKIDKVSVSGANTSIQITDQFMHAVMDNTDYEQRWPCTETPKIVKKENAQKIWNTIINAATVCGCPGLLFRDTICENLPAHCYLNHKFSTVNPCGELPLSANSSCRLISINLTGYVKNPFDKDVYFDFEMFKSDIFIAVQMIDNLIDLEIELITRIINKSDSQSEKELWAKLKEDCYSGRRTGLGTHGLADTLAQLSLRYDSDEAISMVDSIYKIFRDSSYRASIELAKVRGTFPDFNWELEKDNGFIQRLPDDIKEDIKKYGRRNISMLTQAPTGSVSIISKVGIFDAYNVSSGVEPVFRNSYTRKRKISPGDKDIKIDNYDSEGNAWQYFDIYHSNVKCYLNKFNCTIEQLPDFFITSEKVDWKRRIDLQAAEQKYLDGSISSTINCPKGTTIDIVGQIYLYAWQAGLKGITVYVDGSKEGVLITKDDVSEDGRPTQIKLSESPKRPKELPCEIHHSTILGVKWTILVGLLKSSPYELFMGESNNWNIPSKMEFGKVVRIREGIYNLYSNEDELVIDNIVKTANNDAGAWITRLMSMSLRHGIPVEYIVDQLSKDGSIVDINNVLARLLRRYIKKRKISNVIGEVCPQCGSSDLIYSEGCRKCSCGWSGCSG